MMAVSSVCPFIRLSVVKISQPAPDQPAFQLNENVAVYERCVNGNPFRLRLNISSSDQYSRNVPELYGFRPPPLSISSSNPVSTGFPTF